MEIYYPNKKQSEPDWYNSDCRVYYRRRDSGHSWQYNYDPAWDPNYEYTQEKYAILFKCPICGSEPHLLSYERDRDLHPSKINLRYSCNAEGHILSAPWLEAPYLGWDENNENFRQLAKFKWNNMIIDMMQRNRIYGY